MIKPAEYGDKPVAPCSYCSELTDDWDEVCGCCRERLENDESLELEPFPFDID